MKGNTIYMQSIPTEGLRRNLPSLDLFYQLNGFADENAIQLYLVGGSVRDLLLNRPITDLDFTVASNPIAFAQTFADRVDGGFVPLEEQPPTARIVIRDTGLTLDFAQFRAETLEAELCLRDLTINAIAVDFSALLSEPSIHPIDPCNGLEDLKSRLLRFPNEGVIPDDPIRLVRIYRFAAQLGFDIPESEIDLIKQYIERLPEVSAERIRDELMKVFDVEYAVTYLREMDKVGLLSQIIPEIDQMRGVVDVWEQSLLALESFEAKLMPDTLQPYAQEVQEYLSGKGFPSHGKRSVIKLALLLQDVAKPVTKTISPSENTHSHKHEEVGAELAVAIVKRLRLGRKVARLVDCLVRNQLWILNLLNAGNPIRCELTRFLKQTKEDWLGVILLSYADLRASQSPNDVSKAEELIGQIATLYYEEILPMMTHGRLVTGHEIMQALDLKPGVKIGRILKHIEDLQFEGKIGTPEEALVVAKNLNREIELHRSREIETWTRNSF